MTITKFAKFCLFGLFDVILRGNTCISHKFFCHLLLLQFFVLFIFAHFQFNFDFNFEILKCTFFQKKNWSQTHYSNCFISRINWSVCTFHFDLFFHRNKTEQSRKNQRSLILMVMPVSSSTPSFFIQLLLKQFINKIPLNIQNIACAKEWIWNFK